MFANLTNAPARPLVYWLKRLLLRRKPTEDPPRLSEPGALPDLTDRMARDIGLSQSETEYARLQWPSINGPRHPML